MRKSVDNVNDVASPAASKQALCPAQDLVGDVAAAEAVMELVHTVMHQFRSQQHHALRGGPVDVTHMESKVMGFFSRHPGATLSDLVQHSGRDKAQLARLVKGLRERGLLRAEADAADRRNVHLRLSDEGREAQRALRAEARTLSTRAVSDLTAMEQATLVELLGRVNASLNAPV